MPLLPALIRKMIQGRFRIIANKKVGPDFFKMAVYAPAIAKSAEPGQFVHLRSNQTSSPLLRRPFSFHRIEAEGFEILYQVLGQGTRLLARKKKGEKIDALGPLGRGFNLQAFTIRHSPSAILLAGGMGVAPLVALAERLAHLSQPAAKRKKIIVLFGAKNKGAVLCLADFRRLGLKVRIATDDGSLGHKGPVTDLLKQLFSQSTINHQPSTIYACGPRPMLQQVARISKKKKIRAFGSLEEKMACGVGACLGCAIKTRQGYQRVCKEGPVFDLNDIIWR